MDRLSFGVLLPGDNEKERGGGERVVGHYMDKASECVVS